MQHLENPPFTKRVLIVGRNPLHLAGLLNFLYESGYDSIGALDNDEAIRFFKEHDPHIVIISHFVDENSRELLKNIFLQINPTLTLFEFSGGVSALNLLMSKNYNI